MYILVGGYSPEANTFFLPESDLLVRPKQRFLYPIVPRHRIALDARGNLPCTGRLWLTEWHSMVQTSCGRLVGQWDGAAQWHDEMKIDASFTGQLPRCFL